MKGLVLLLLLVVASAADQWGVVNVAMADLRAKPAARYCCPVNWLHDEAQLTQLLYYDPVRIINTTANGWSYVEAVDQPMLYNDTWSGYRGFIDARQVTVTKQPYVRGNVSVVVPHAVIFRRYCLLDGCLPEDVVVRASFGTWLTLVSEANGWAQVLLADGSSTGYMLRAELATFLSPSDEEAVRELFVERSRLLLGYIYSWGGRSSFSLPDFTAQFSGLDCSGLTSILYRSCGLIIPRDASKQALWTHNVSSPSLLLPGDVFFYGVANVPSLHVYHVMGLYSLSSTPQLVEAAPNASHILDIERVYGKPLANLRWGEKLTGGMDPGAHISWGTFFPLRTFNYSTGP